MSLFTCEHCGKSFESERGLRGHITKTHTEQPVTYGRKSIYISKDNETIYKKAYQIATEGTDDLNLSDAIAKALEDYVKRYKYKLETEYDEIILNKGKKDNLQTYKFVGKKVSYDEKSKTTAYVSEKGNIIVSYEKNDWLQFDVLSPHQIDNIESRQLKKDITEFMYGDTTITLDI